MKLNLHRETLLDPLQLVIGVVERKQTLAILSNVLLSIKGKKISITGTDLEIELIGQADLFEPVARACQITLPGRKLIDICKALPENAAIELSQEKEQIILRSGRSRFSLSTLPAEDFPNTEPQEKHFSFALPQKQFRYLLQRSYFAMAQQDVRTYLNGMLLEISAAKLKAVATDGHRLAINAIDLPSAVETPLQIILPRKGVMELMRLLDDNDAPIVIEISNNHLRITGEQFTFTSKLIEGKFPNYNQVIPKNGNKLVSMERDTLKQSLIRTSILCNEKFRGIRFELRRSSLKVSANNPEQEAAEEELQIDYPHDEALDIGFNVNYLLDILNTLKPGKIQLSFADANSSVLLEEVGQPEESTFVVMPMRL